MEETDLDFNLQDHEGSDLSSRRTSLSQDDNNDRPLKNKKLEGQNKVMYGIILLLLIILIIVKLLCQFLLKVLMD